MIVATWPDGTGNTFVGMSPGVQAWGHCIVYDLVMLPGGLEPIDECRCADLMLLLAAGQSPGHFWCKLSVLYKYNFSFVVFLFLFLLVSVMTILLTRSSFQQLSVVFDFY